MNPVHSCFSFGVSRPATPWKWMVPKGWQWPRSVGMHPFECQVEVGLQRKPLDGSNWKLFSKCVPATLTFIIFHKLCDDRLKSTCIAMPRLCKIVHVKVVLSLTWRYVERNALLHSNRQANTIRYFESARPPYNNHEFTKCHQCCIVVVPPINIVSLIKYARRHRSKCHWGEN